MYVYIYILQNEEQCIQRQIMFGLYMTAPVLRLDHTTAQYFVLTIQRLENMISTEVKFAVV